MSVRDLRFGSESCCSKVMASDSSASQLLIRMRGEFWEGFVDGFVGLVWFGLR